ncbi:MAG TPA: hypothetical protein VGK33_19545 [Chloroflexota bacterium]|jgi:predicted transcriptional regulator
MAGLKVTLSAAMRARDVSRPRLEHLAEAAARDEPVTAERAVASASDEAPVPRRRRRRRIR